MRNRTCSRRGIYRGLRMEDTIAAISTATGEGGIGIVRVSGPQAETVLTTLFRPPREKGDAGAFSFSPRHMTYGSIIDPDSGEVIDEVMAVLMRAPHTYTCEDVAEIHCHGSVVSLRRILQLCYAHGARPAERGEFTKRAFLNGRLDLSQAEAVIDVVRAQTDRSQEAAIAQLEGSLSTDIRALRADLLDLLVNMAVNLDYPDEDIEEVMYQDLLTSLEDIRGRIRQLLDTADSGRILREGLRAAIIGRPNVGKSSLLNALLRESRAIVTEIPGTTRDTIEEAVSVRGIPVLLTDTAGIRETDDAIERLGIEKSRQSFAAADLVFLLLDGSQPLQEDDHRLLEKAGSRHTVVIINKRDLGERVSEAEIREDLPQARILRTSMKSEKDIAKIEDIIEELVYRDGVVQQNSTVVTNARHADLLRRAESAVGDAIDVTGRGEALDFIEVDVRRCYELLGEIIGESVSDDIIDEVFSRFCLGK